VLVGPQAKREMRTSRSPTLRGCRTLPLPRRSAGRRRTRRSSRGDRSAHHAAGDVRTPGDLARRWRRWVDTEKFGRPARFRPLHPTPRRPTLLGRVPGRAERGHRSDGHRRGERSHCSSRWSPWDLTRQAGPEPKHVQGQSATVRLSLQVALHLWPTVTAGWCSLQAWWPIWRRLQQRQPATESVGAPVGRRQATNGDWSPSGRRMRQCPTERASRRPHFERAGEQQLSQCSVAPRAEPYFARQRLGPVRAEQRRLSFRLPCPWPQVRGPRMFSQQYQPCPHITQRIPWVQRAPSSGSGLEVLTVGGPCNLSTSSPSVSPSTASTCTPGHRRKIAP